MSTDAVIIERALTPEEAALIRGTYRKIEDDAASVERAAIVRAIRAEADDYHAAADDLALRVTEITTEEAGRISQLWSTAAALRRLAVVISKRETEDRP
jgi:hypothetical protein